MGSLKFPHTSGNSMSIAAPATNPASDLELKLPATIGSANQVLRNSSTAGTLEFATLAGGKVLQYVYATGNTDVTTSGGSENEVIDATITPASTSNKILVKGFVLLDIDNSGSAYADVKLYRGSASGTEIMRAIAGNSTSANIVHAVNPWMLDSPNTTSAQEYTITISRGAGTTSQVSTSGATNYNLLLLEIEG